MIKHNIIFRKTVPIYHIYFYTRNNLYAWMNYNTDCDYSENRSNPTFLIRFFLIFKLMLTFSAITLISYTTILLRHASYFFVTKMCRLLIQVVRYTCLFLVTQHYGHKYVLRYLRQSDSVNLSSVTIFHSGMFRKLVMKFKNNDLKYINVVSII